MSKDCCNYRPKGEITGGGGGKIKRNQSAVTDQAMIDKSLGGCGKKILSPDSGYKGQGKITNRYDKKGFA